MYTHPPLIKPTLLAVLLIQTNVSLSNTHHSLSYKPTSPFPPQAATQCTQVVGHTSCRRSRPRSRPRASAPCSVSLAPPQPASIKHHGERTMSSPVRHDGAQERERMIINEVPRFNLPLMHSSPTGAGIKQRSILTAAARAVPCSTCSTMEHPRRHTGHGPWAT